MSAAPFQTPSLASCFSYFYSGSSLSELPRPLGCQLWSAVPVLTLHPIPVSVKEALGRVVGNKIKRHEADRGGWDEWKESWHAEEPPTQPAPSVSPKWLMPALFPPVIPASFFLTNSGW